MHTNCLAFSHFDQRLERSRTLRDGELRLQIRCGRVDGCVNAYAHENERASVNVRLSVSEVMTLMRLLML